MARRWLPTKQEIISGLESIGKIFSYFVGGLFALGVVFMIYNVVDELFFSTPYEREFVCSDYSTTKELSAEQLQNVLSDHLGSVLKIHFYENYVGVNIVKEKKDTNYIFKKVGEDRYEYDISPKNKVVLTIECPYGIILSAKIQQTNPLGTSTAIMKRNL